MDSRLHNWGARARPQDHKLIFPNTCEVLFFHQLSLCIPPVVCVYQKHSRKDSIGIFPDNSKWWLVLLNPSAVYTFVNVCKCLWWVNFHFLLDPCAHFRSELVKPVGVSKCLPSRPFFKGGYIFAHSFGGLSPVGLLLWILWQGITWWGAYNTAKCLLVESRKQRMEGGGCPNTTFKDLPPMSQLHSFSPHLLKDPPSPGSARDWQPNL